MQIAMMYLGLVLFISSGMMLVRMFFFRKTFKWLSDDVKEVQLDNGKYNLIVFGKISDIKHFKRLNFKVADARTKEAIDVSPLQIPYAGLSKFKTFYRVGAFMLDRKRTIQGSILGLENLHFTGSRLFLKNFLFPKRTDGKVYVGVIKYFNLFFVLVLLVLNIVSLFIVFRK